MFLFPGLENWFQSPNGQQSVSFAHLAHLYLCMSCLWTLLPTAPFRSETGILNREAKPPQSHS